MKLHDGANWPMSSDTSSATDQDELSQAKGTSATCAKIATSLSDPKLLRIFTSRHALIEGNDA